MRHDSTANDQTLVSKKLTDKKAVQVGLAKQNLRQEIVQADKNIAGQSFNDQNPKPLFDVKKVNKMEANKNGMNNSDAFK